MKAIIAGGGIGGLTAALCLQRVGWEVEVHERAPALTEAGAGLQVSPNGCRVLAALELLETAADLGFRPERIDFRLGESGREVFSIPLAGEAERRWGAPYLHLHRADLIDVLGDSLAWRAPGALRLNSSISEYRQDDDGVEVQLSSGERSRGDMLVGADGIHSQVRRQMLGTSMPRFTGNVAWRATVPVERLGNFVPPPTACIWAGAGRHAVTYRLRGGREANFVGVVERSGWTTESWTEQGTREEVLRDFPNWHPIVTTLIEQADSHYRWALFDRPPLARWSDGRVLLLGDACHPMLPFLAQGAVMAMEDAWCLAERVQADSDIPRALASVFSARIARTSRVQAGARRNASRFHYRHALTRFAAYTPLWLAARVSPGLIQSRQDWLYGYDVTKNAGTG